MVDDAMDPALPTDSPVEGAPALGAGLSDPGQWVELHGNYLFRYALIRVRNETVAEDLVQDTLLAAFQGKDRFSGQSTERSWLTGILKHKVLDYFRRQARERTIMEDASMPEELEGRFDDLGLWKHEPESGPTDWGADAAGLMQRKEFMAALKQCISKLPPRCADAFVLREMEATDSDRIQEMLGVSPSNFWVLLHRARMQLRLCLEQNWLKH
ncbi:MAG: sigma-70 family RNA polymerase sigma factor [Verrucomicrobia subdivision 3 bacterium]|nr:sigma-70 family RNA polymerase sigma factor [Limisphaerales bacterium]